MYNIDFHCDTILKLYETKSSLYENDFSVDIVKLKKSNSLAQFFAIFTDIEVEKKDGLFNTAVKKLEYFKEEIKNNSSFIKLGEKYEDISEDILTAFLTLEEGQVIEGDLDNINFFYKNGVRLITPLWNYENDFGYSHLDTKKGLGLKRFGFESIELMDYLNIIVDVSHMSDKAFFDTAMHSKKPIIASHSNARSITNVSRNLTDEMIKIIANSGGIIGINFCNWFLGDDNISSISSMIRHINHIKNVGGIDVVSIGSDFDGIENETEMKDIGEINLLAKALINEGYSNENVEKIMFKNGKRLIKECIL